MNERTSTPELEEKLKQREAQQQSSGKDIETFEELLDRVRRFPIPEERGSTQKGTAWIPGSSIGERCKSKR
jgi:hypothetical protein